MKPTIYLPPKLAKLLIPVLADAAGELEDATPLPCFCSWALPLAS
jgi:hypothetical protein